MIGPAAEEEQVTFDVESVDECSLWRAVRSLAMTARAFTAAKGVSAPSRFNGPEVIGTAVGPRGEGAA